uniref:C-type lectin domain-containing protein n=1 Tax=Caenorhabditis tropicalis TaxID=1561998 RepID=A0A1I7TQ00_9PELO
MLIVSVNARCLSIGDLCYTFPNLKLNYVDAKNYCSSMNQNLATVRTEKQHSYLSAVARVRWASSLFWIDLSRPSINAPFVWSDDSVKDSLYVAGSTETGKWLTVDGEKELNFICSYPNSDTSNEKSDQKSELLSRKDSDLKPNVTCLFMVDFQSSGISQAAISTYKSYFNFAQLVASKLNDESHFTGYLDTFGYSASLADHKNIPTYSYENFRTLPFSILDTDDDIDMDLKDVDSSLRSARWIPPVEDQTCMVFFSAAPESLYGGSEIQTTYDSFQTVIGVLVGGATSIPGLTNPIAATTLSDADASAVVELLLRSLPSN